MSYRSDSRALASTTPFILSLTGTPLGYPVLAPCHGDPAALDLQACPLHMLQQFIDKVDVGMDQLITWVLGLGGSWVGQPAGFPSSTVSTLSR